MDIRLNIRDDSNCHFNKYLEKIKISGKIRTTRFFYEMAKKNRFYELENINDFCNKIDNVISTLKRVHGNNWDFHLTPISIDNKLYYNIHILIYYDNITINNSKNESHNIKGLIFKLDLVFNNSNFYFENLAITRSNLSYLEYLSSYLHSHVSSFFVYHYDYVFEFKNCCLGSGEINEVLTTLQLNYSEEQFELLLYSINSYVEWESIEGVPYIRMNTIINNSNNYRHTLNNIIKKDMINNLISKINKEEIKLLSNKFINNNIVLINNNILHQTIINILIRNNYSFYFNNILYIDTNNGKKAYSENEINFDETIHYYNNEKVYTYIQNKKLEFNIEIPQTTVFNIKNYKVDESIINEFKQKYENKIKLNRVRKSVIDTKN